MPHPTTDELAEDFREHLIETFDCAVFGEDRFRREGDNFTYEIDMAEGDIVLMEDNHSEDTGRRFAVEIEVRVKRLPDEPSHPFQPVAGHPDDNECTFREDGTDSTYCGLPGGRHRHSLR
jgi:hypothetical protein